MQIILKVSLFFLFLYSCKTQEKKTLASNVKENTSIVGGGCEGCELMYDGMPSELKSHHQSPGWNSSGQKLLIEGTVFELDGKTPENNVIVYYWHTDKNGLYSSNSNYSKAYKHGSLRGWIKTGQDGKFSIKTSRPSPYPEDEIPAHIHLSVKEPDVANEYYLDWYFDDDPLYLKHKKRYGKADRGGTEILRILVDNDVQKAERNII